MDIVSIERRMKCTALFPVMTWAGRQRQTEDEKNHRQTDSGTSTHRETQLTDSLRPAYFVSLTHDPGLFMTRHCLEMGNSPDPSTPSRQHKKPLQQGPFKQDKLHLIHKGWNHFFLKPSWWSSSAVLYWYILFSCMWLQMAQSNFAMNQSWLD